MIGYLQGEVIHVSQNALTVLAGGVGYEVLTTTHVASQHPAGNFVRLWVHSAIREQAWDLYGFLQKEDRDLFRLVQKVPKIGSKTAQSMLATFSAPVLLRVISEGDVAALSSVPGIGKKTAERIVVELKDMFAKMAAASDLPPAGPGRDGYEAVQALLSLGYNASEARERVALAIKTGVSSGDVEALVRAVLAQDN